MSFLRLHEAHAHLLMGLVPGKLSEAPGQPAVLADPHQRLGSREHLEVQGSGQNEQRAAGDEEDVDRAGQNDVGNQGQRLVSNFRNRQNIRSYGSSQAVQKSSVAGGDYDNKGNILCGVLTLVRGGQNNSCTAGSEAQVSNCGQEAADTIGQEQAVRIAEVVAEVHIGEAEYSEYYQSSDQGDNQQVLNIGSQGQRRRRPGR